MPLPIIQRPVEIVPTDKKGIRVFVSYSHRDAEGSKLFTEFFLNQLDATPELRIKKEHVYYDRAKLHAGDDWHESIQQALDEAQYFIFLVSNNSLSSKYCITRELANAAKRDLPILQILLSPCPWEGRPIPEDRKKRTLGAIGALPKDDQFRLRPISGWRDRADVWNRVVKDITTLMLSKQAQPVPWDIMVEPLSREQLQLRQTPLLPYLCNQDAAVSRFNDRIKIWDNKLEKKALMVLVRGIHDDNIPRFWNRLNCKNLQDWLAVRNEQLLPTSHLMWPSWDGRTLKMENEMAFMREALSESLTKTPFALLDASSLQKWLATGDGVVPVETILPKASKKYIRATLQALLNLIEECPTGTRLDRLVFSVMVENQELIAERDLCKALNLKNHSKTHIIELMPLRELSMDDIRRWHHAHEIEKISGFNDDQLMQKVFGDRMNSSVRMRPFDILVRPFLGL